MPTASIERAAPAARSSFWMPPSLLGYDDVTGPPFLGNQHDTVRCGFLPRRSYVAPSRRSRGSAKRARKELTYCPIYGFKPCVICAKDLTPALFCGRCPLAWCAGSRSPDLPCPVLPLLVARACGVLPAPLRAGERGEAKWPRLVYHRARPPSGKGGPRKRRPSVRHEHYPLLTSDSATALQQAPSWRFFIAPVFRRRVPASRAPRSAATGGPPPR